MYISYVFQSFFKKINTDTYLQLSKRQIRRPKRDRKIGPQIDNRKKGYMYMFIYIYTYMHIISP